MGTGRSDRQVELLQEGQAKGVRPSGPRGLGAKQGSRGALDRGLRGDIVDCGRSVGLPAWSNRLIEEEAGPAYPGARGRIEGAVARAAARWGNDVGPWLASSIARRKLDGTKP